MNDAVEITPPPPLKTMAEEMLLNNAFWADPGTPFVAHMDGMAQLAPAERKTVNSSRVLLVAGDNASGKSLFVEYLRGYAKHFHGCTSISISIRERTGSGLSDMSGMRRTMIFGDESEQSTGATSVRVLQTAFNNLDAWTQNGHDVLMVLDEPELGLSDAYSYAMGLLIAQRMSEITSPKANLVVVTHSKRLASGLVDGLAHQVPFIHMNEALQFTHWVARESVKSVQELLDLNEAGSAGRRNVRGLERKITDEFRAQEEATGSGKRIGSAGVRKQRTKPKN